MSDDKRDPMLSLEQMLEDLKPDDYKTEHEDREWLDSSVGKEILDPDKKESISNGYK